MEEKYPKGTKGNPFYVLEYSFKKGILRLDPYPLMDEKKTHGPRLILKNMWPDITNGSLSLGIPTSFLCVDSGPAGNIDLSRSDIIRLAEKIEKERSVYCQYPECKLNAYLLHLPADNDEKFQPIIDEFKKKNPDYCRFFILPIQFFHIDVTVPKEMREQVKVMEALGI